jgi:flagellar hook protein FlgE
VFPGFTVTQDGTGPDTVTTSIDVFDTLGRPHPVTMVLTRTADNVWDMKASLPAADGTLADDTMTGIRFNADGSFASVTGTGSGDDRLIFNFVGLDTPQTVALGLGSQGKFDGLTMLGDKSTATAASQDGAPAGELLDVSFSQTGVLEGYYSNGKTSPIATLRIALFSNPAGLSRIGDSLMVESSNSSSAILTTAGGGGSGKIISGALEGSNVDVAEEFVKLIEAQRGFQASARVVSTSDEILAELMNIVR